MGWVDASGRRKERDWMSQSQLIARTGRNSAALSAALDVLVQQNLVQCQTETSELLLTPQQRCSHRGRVYFCLAPQQMQLTKSELQKANRTKEKENKRNSLYMEGQKNKNTQLYSDWASAGEVASEVARNRGYEASSSS